MRTTATASLPLVLAALIWRNTHAQEVTATNPQLRSRTLSLVDDNNNSQEDGFGLKPVKDVPSIEMRIVGGSDADAKDYPWHVNLDGCGGTLIAPDIVLSAAHCSALRPTAALVGGSTYLTGTPRYVQRGSALIHPEYSSRSESHDLMLYKLTQPVTDKPFAVLNDDSERPNADDTLTVLGFGHTKENGQGSFDLQKVNVNWVPTGRCNAAYWGRVRDDSMFCAGAENGGKDSCQGDSGGPVVNQDGVLMGVTSWGNGCGKRGFPGVYAKVSNDLEWIQGHACRMSDSPPDYCEDVDIPEEPSTPGSGSGNSSGGGMGFFDWLASLFGF